MTRRSRAARSALLTALFFTLARSAEATDKKPEPPETSTPAGPWLSTIVKQLAEWRPPELRLSKNNLKTIAALCLRAAAPWVGCTRVWTAAANRTFR